MIVSVVVGSALAALLVPLARRRTRNQPLPVDADAEALLIGAVYADPGLARQLDQVSAGAFSDPDRAAAWQDALDATGDACGPVPAKVTLAAHKVAVLAEDRQLYQSLVRAEADEEGAWRWVQPKLTVRRLLLAGALGALYAAAIAVLAPTLTAYGIAALVVVAAASIIISLVDIDTMLIDLATLWPATLAALVLTAAELQRSEALWQLAGAVAVAAVLMLVLTVANWASRRALGQDGMGGGDLQLLPLVMVVPVALTGQLDLIYFAFMAALFAFLAVVLAGKLADPSRELRATPQPFGPALAAGWSLAVLAQHTLTLL
jgi:prepilin signal peptidase PulO-like enzyme (type II secretory pathway)